MMYLDTTTTTTTTTARIILLEGFTRLQVPWFLFKFIGETAVRQTIPKIHTCAGASLILAEACLGTCACVQYMYIQCLRQPSYMIG
jgi:hypothetical protein